MRKLDLEWFILHFCVSVFWSVKLKVLTLTSALQLCDSWMRTALRMARSVSKSSKCEAVCIYWICKDNKGSLGHIQPLKCLSLFSVRVTSTITSNTVIFFYAHNIKQIRLQFILQLHYWILHLFCSLLVRSSSLEWRTWRVAFKYFLDAAIVAAMDCRQSWADFIKTASSSTYNRLQ